MLPTLQTTARWSEFQLYSANNRVRRKAGNDMALIPDSILWDRFREGHELSFVKIYKEYVNVLFNYGKKFCKDTELVRDCIQDFFVYLNEHRSGLGPTTSIRYYLLLGFRRRLMVLSEKAAKHQLCQYEEVEFELELAECDVEKNIHQEHLTVAASKINHIIKQLIPREREALYFYYYENMSYKEIAEIMQFSQVSSARRLIYSALRNLRDLY